MTGVEHYRTAEQILACTKRPSFGDHPGGAEEMAMYAEAQVHATLALAAAMALANQPTMPDVDFSAWDQAAGVLP